MNISQTYRFPDWSIIISPGRLKLELKPGASRNPSTPDWPAIVETIYPELSGVNIRIV